MQIYTEEMIPLSEVYFLVSVWGLALADTEYGPGGLVLLFL